MVTVLQRHVMHRKESTQSTQMIAGRCAVFGASGMIGVRWDKNVQGHSCGGHCEFGHGWNVWPRDLVLIDEEDTDCDIDEDTYLSII